MKKISNLLVQSELLLESATQNIQDKSNNNSGAYQTNIIRQLDEIKEKLRKVMHQIDQNSIHVIMSKLDDLNAKIQEWHFYMYKIKSKENNVSTDKMLEMYDEIMKMADDLLNYLKKSY